jgi:hypothetical protein
MTATNANTYTVTIADAGSAHTVSQAGVAAPPNTDTPSGKLKAALDVLQNAIEQPAAFAAFVAAGTWTITITQP